MSFNFICKYQRHKYVHVYIHVNKYIHILNTVKVLCEWDAHYVRIKDP